MSDILEVDIMEFMVHYLSIQLSSLNIGVKMGGNGLGTITC